MTKFLFALPAAALLALSAHSAFGSTAQDTDAPDPDIQQSFALMQAGKAKSATGLLAKVSSDAEKNIKAIADQMKDGKPLSSNDLFELERNLNRASDAAIGKGYLLKNFHTETKETTATQNNAHQLRQTAQKAFDRAKQATAAATSGDCAGYFAQGLGMDVSPLVGTATATLSPEQAEAVYFAHEKAQYIFLLTEKAVQACEGFLMNPRTPKASSPAQTIDGELAQVRPALNKAEASEPNSKQQNNFCSVAGSHILKAIVNSQTGSRALYDTSQQSESTALLLAALADTLDSTSQIAYFSGEYTRVCGQPKAETQATRNHAAEMDNQASKLFEQNGIQSALLEEGNCAQAQANERTFSNRNKKSGETGLLKTISPAEGKAVQTLSEAKTQELEIRARLIRQCSGTPIPTSHR